MAELFQFSLLKVLPLECVEEMIYGNSEIDVINDKQKAQCIDLKKYVVKKYYIPKKNSCHRRHELLGLMVKLTIDLEAKQ